MKFLIDECLTVELADEANRSGFAAYHVAHLGLAGRKDWNLVRRALHDDLILVTNNARDFRSLYGQEKIHPGLVILIPNVKIACQILLFRAALRQLRALTDPANKVVAVDLVGDAAVVRVYEQSTP